MKPSGIRAFFDLVLGMKDVISLGVGEPDFVTPWQIREAGITSLEQGFTSYTSNKGLYKLRLSIAQYMKNRYGLVYSPDDEILITVGVSEAKDLAMRTILNPGDKVLVCSPSYVSYGPLVELAGGKPVYIDTRSSGFKLSPKALGKAIDKKTKALILNYPSNPTGVSYIRKELSEINRVLLKRNILCVSDEIYGDLSYDFEHTPFPVLSGAKENCIYLNGFSKSYAMTGWRVGYACGPKDIIAGMTKIHQYTIMCVPITSQMAAAEAIHTGRKSVEEMKREYKRRREFMCDGLTKLRLDYVMPQGAFYFFVSVKNTGMSSLKFAERLLKEEKVALVPGTAFGESFDDYVRISYASSYENLKESLIRIGSFLNRRKGRG
ncbi:MAG: aminotransferase class I/II-fold pyridoxal phosphate-dependent enzyme [Candidatus Omnitrophota bacterium]|nr:aminotransferase class I/II-fold pyridoxal phosphate-dependent enzyme [Candidatus Omnitrophota bacterium]MBU1929375.1 aminotransferase class I/II-fold pyridoxal phosphate-dependent enzyme [Candidatus Omnitrophota bacterium]MBU2034885.1 aminotransferase class I/II-fold pyridoxal phosphate-dependent enzyme [Candidatus Omnitrophota bacterium]MBU2222094.1 aminotransferase class I/II-fold pyridoxal phosphate-dependent enzyme [Candidatus Omnitrophota bacterium]MBU2258872.1 aminotransferase class I